MWKTLLNTEGNFFDFLNIDFNVALRQVLYSK